MPGRAAGAMALVDGDDIRCQFNAMLVTSEW
jgi:hypothetical protein